MQAINGVRNCAVSKFDETLEVTANLNIDPKKTNVIIRGLLSLPHGTGKHPRICVLAEGKYASDAQEAGADRVGLDEIINEIKGGKIDFDILLTAPRFVPRLAPVARILGPKKLMPSTRNGTVSNDLPHAIRDALRGVTEIKPDKSAAIRTGIGKLSFTNEQLYDNLKEFIVITLSSIKPPTVKKFVNSVCICSTHGPSFFLDTRFITPGRYFFNEELADSSVVIPERKKKLSTRKRHALKAAEREKEEVTEGEMKDTTTEGETKNPATEGETKVITTDVETKATLTATE
ncbi:ribosomal protein L1 [Blastocystis sp. subtype 4]|uniref:ribosomal protein L1 n=1 Tax=Blastocystis sp. subtype 4 TaxID=944170 RepID=UPI0007121BE7|nr:ribosomal protein L1 [Blastocystis sp. subtype 4]KNB46662.1 ribosomal protein L1 [Blastocystis sp. subtype 4]|eukprot:XP_014530133.1 ribosomal protein L1 [Blastocystis sp. subtype 4]